jgi:hypothetical protein
LKRATQAAEESKGGSRVETRERRGKLARGQQIRGETRGNQVDVEVEEKSQRAIEDSQAGSSLLFKRKSCYWGATSSKSSEKRLSLQQTQNDAKTNGLN